MADNIMVPSGSGGLLNFNQGQSGTKFQVKPAHVIGFVVAIVVFRIALEFLVK